jgi:hypothetical protein
MIVIWLFSVSDDEGQENFNDKKLQVIFHLNIRKPIGYQPNFIEIRQTETETRMLG